MKRIFLDCDGVLADFDHAAERLFHMPSREAQHKLGNPVFWKRIRKAGHFYRHLPLLPDAMELFRAVEHLNPTILTGVPVGGWAEEDKIAWAAEHFPGVPIVTCWAKQKFLHVKHPGDALVDDYLKYKQQWEQAGGVFIHHKTARESIRHLAELGFDVKLPQAEAGSPAIAQNPRTMRCFSSFIELGCDSLFDGRKRKKCLQFHSSSSTTIVISTQRLWSTPLRRTRLIWTRVARCLSPLPAP